MTDPHDSEEDVLLTTKRQKTKKIAIDSDEEDRFSSFLAKPSKQEKEPLERKEYVHNSSKKNSSTKPQILKEKSTIHPFEANISEKLISKDEKLVSNGDKDHHNTKNKENHQTKEKEHLVKEKVLNFKEKEHVNKEKENATREKEHHGKEKDQLQKANTEKEKPKNSLSQTQKTNDAKKNTATKEKPKPKSLLKSVKNSPTKPSKYKSDSENSLFDPEISSEEDKDKTKVIQKNHVNNKEESNKKAKKPIISKPEIKTNFKQREEKQKIGNLKPKDSIIKGILRRWWYCMDDWPPANFDYDALLKEKGLRQVDIINWKNEPEKDEKDLSKVFQIEAWPGLFRNSKGILIDLRPKDSCPCFDSLKKKNVEELIEMYKTALFNQIKHLENFKEHESPELMAELKKELNKMQKFNLQGSHRST